MKRLLYPPNKRATFLCTVVVGLMALPRAEAQTSTWVKTGVTGRLIYAPDAEGDRIPDFSMVGYGEGKRAIPADIPVVVHIDPIAGDNTTHIQNAINFAATRPVQANGYRGIVEFGPGKFNVDGHLSITASGVVLRGAGGGDSLASNTHIVSQNRTDTFDSASTPVINIQGSSSGIARGPQIQILDKRVPVGAQSFRVASTAGMAVGGMVEIFRPSTQAWIEELGMHLIPDGKEWSAGDRELDWQRRITRIEGNRVYIDAPITTALDAEWGGGTVRTYSVPNRIRNVGVENLRGQSLDAREETNELRTPSFVRFTRVEDGFVRDVETRHFPYASVFTSEADGTQHITVDNVTSRLPSGVVTGGRRYTFAMDGQMSLVKNSFAEAGRHDFVTGSDVVGPIVFVDSSTSGTRADSGPHHRWGNGLLFDSIDINGNAINVQNRWTSGSGHGWAGANVVVWNSEANSFIVQSPPTAQSWLIGSTGTVNAGDCHLGGATCAGFNESHGTKVIVGGEDSLYQAQVNDAADIREFHWSAGSGNWNDDLQWSEKVKPGVYSVSSREYLVGDYDNYVNDGAGSVDIAFADPDWQNAIRASSPLPLAGLDDLGGSKNVVYTVQQPLAARERVVHGYMALSLKQGGPTPGLDFIRFFDMDPAHILRFAAMGWDSQINTTTPFVGVVDLGHFLDEMQGGAVNVQVHDDTGLDWAVYTAVVATPKADPIGAAVFLDGGQVRLDSAVDPVASLTNGGPAPSTLTMAASSSLTVNDDYLQAANGTLAFEIGGPGAGEFGKLTVSDDATLGGTLALELVNGYQPTVGHAFEILSAESLLGTTFAATQLPMLPSTMGWQVLYQPNAVVARILAVVVPGDYNRDGAVDAADYIIWRDTLDQTVAAAGDGADGNANGSIDPGDYTVWQANFGRTAGSGSSFAQAPEPATATLILALLAIWTVLAKCRR